MAQLRFNTARLLLQYVLGELGPMGGGGELGSGAEPGRGLVIGVTGVLSFSPLEAALTETVEGFGLPGGREGPHGKPTLGEETTVTRTIGRAVYTYRPSVAGYDGGRPWVRSENPPPGHGGPSTGLSAIFDSVNPLSGGSGSAQKGSNNLFAKLIGELNEAQSVREVGPASVDGQQTTEFTATIPLTDLLTPRQQAEIEKTGSSAALFTISPTVKTKLSEMTVTVELFIAPNGLPVRTISVLGDLGEGPDRSEGIGSEIDLLGLEVPVHVHAPPARLTISQARLSRLEEKRIRQQLCGLHPAHGALAQAASRIHVIGCHVKRRK